jgi:23S rRNA pseudouridine1911/1915/1917 synthase
MPANHNVEHPMELLQFLLASHPNVTRSKVQKWLKHGTVHVNGESITQFNHPLLPGDHVSLGDQAASRGASQLPTGMRIAFEDSTLIVIEKPENLLSIATETEREKTAHSCLTSYLRRGNPKRPERVWIVHRLDRETSGLMVFAKTEAAKKSLQTRWQEIEKRYLAVVDGAPPTATGVLKSHLDESNPFKVYSVPQSERTRPAVTHYQTIKQSSSRTLLELTLETGRRNQIRVHLADVGCPIVGDDKYEALSNPAGRLGLHSSYLKFIHPVTNEILTFESSLPQCLSRLV